MFDSVLDFVGRILAFFYEIIPNYAVAIALLTLLVMVVTTPLTLKGTRSMIRLQLLQPEMRRIQQQHKGDRQALNEAMMRFYQENEVNPVGGCLPLIVQMPVFLVLFRVVRGITETNAEGVFTPMHLTADSALFRSLSGETRMDSFGLDLSQSATTALRDGIIHGLPYVALILIQIAASYVQQKQVSARNKDGQVALPQQQMLLRVMPAVFGFISIGFPAALVVYWVTSSLYRIGLQGYITRSLYHGDDSLGAQAQKASAEARRIKDGDGKAGGSPVRADKPARPDKSDGKAGAAEPKTPAAPLGSGRITPPKGGAPGASSGPRPHPSSKKKKRRRR